MKEEACGGGRGEKRARNGMEWMVLRGTAEYMWLAEGGNGRTGVWGRERQRDLGDLPAMTPLVAGGPIRWYTAVVEGLALTLDFIRRSCVLVMRAGWGAPRRVAG